MALEDVRLREPALDAGLRARLEEIVGAGAVRSDREARVLRCRGKSYLDLLAQRAGECEDAPDAVVAPGGHDEVLAVLQACSEAGVAVVPFGGGTSVVGGLEPDRGRFGAVISLDLGRMDRVLDVDERSVTAVLEPGLRLPEADRALAAHGLTLGHVPQSYEWATVGGCVATRSAGQVSTGRGRIDANLLAARCATPLGELATLDAPASAAGPALRQLVAGSEGALGVITQVALRVHRGAGVPALRGLAGAGLRDRAATRCARSRRPASRPTSRGCPTSRETRFSLAFAGAGQIGQRDGRAALPADLRLGGLLRLGHPPAPRGRARAAPRSSARYVTQRAGRQWLASRFAGPHLRDGLMDRGVMVETLETATSWSNLPALHDAVHARCSRAPSPAATSRTCTRPARRCTSRSSAAATTPTRPVSGARSSRPPARRSWRPAARSRTTTRSAATTRRGWRPRTARSASSSCAR